MHQDYFFILHLSQKLEPQLLGLTLLDCHWNESQQFIAGFASPEHEQWVGLKLSPTFQSFFFPASVRKYGLKIQDIFPSLLHHTVQYLNTTLAKPCLIIGLSDKADLVFWLEGQKSWAGHYHHRQLQEFWAASPTATPPNDLPSEMRTPKEAFEVEGLSFAQQWLGRAVAKQFPFTGDVAADRQLWPQVAKAAQALTNAPGFWVQNEGNSPFLKIVTGESLTDALADPMEAAHLFFQAKQKAVIWQAQQKQVLKKLKKRIKKTGSAIQKAEQRLLDIDGRRYRETADIIMANLHQIPHRSESVTLFDFYREEEVLIRLDVGKSPQRFAEKLYQKAKKQHVEESYLKKKLTALKDREAETQSLLVAAQEATSNEQWEGLLGRHPTLKALIG